MARAVRAKGTGGGFEIVEPRRGHTSSRLLNSWEKSMKGSLATPPLPSRSLALTGFGAPFFIFSPGLNIVVFALLSYLVSPLLELVPFGRGALDFRALKIRTTERISGRIFMCAGFGASSSSAVAVAGLFRELCLNSVIWRNAISSLFLGKPGFYIASKGFLLVRLGPLRQSFNCGFFYSLVW